MPTGTAPPAAALAAGHCPHSTAANAGCEPRTQATTLSAWRTHCKRACAQELSRPRSTAQLRLGAAGSFPQGSNPGGWAAEG
eukprot:scaffold223985_cov17-Tisochrysis_lutea.AAC.1